MDVTIRKARLEDESDIASFTRDTWPERDVGDYVPEMFEEWVETDSETRRTFVAEIEGRAVGLVQAVVLSEYEAWLQAMRVDPDYRNREIGFDLNVAARRWARERGAAIARIMVFSWNPMGLGHGRAAGFEPATEFRWAHPDPDPDADPDAEIAADPDAAWTYWSRSDARASLRGLALDMDETWAVSELIRERLARAAEETWLGVLQRGGTRGFAYRARDREDVEGGRIAEYGLAVWDDAAAAESLFAAIAADAAGLGADRTRVLIPESVDTVSDAALAGVPFDEGTDFVLAFDLAGSG